MNDYDDYDDDYDGYDDGHGASDEERLTDELLDYCYGPAGDERDRLIAEVAAEAKERGYLHAQILGHLIPAINLREGDDLNHVLGSCAQAQRLWRENADEISPDFTQLLLSHMHSALHVLLSHTTVPLDSVESLRAYYEELCRQHGHSLRGAFELALMTADRRGDRATADNYLQRALNEPTDRSNSFAVKPFIDYLADNGDDEAAIGFFNGIDFERATPRQANSAKSMVILPLTRLGQSDRAEQMYNDSLNIDNLYSFGHLVLYLAMRGRYDEALGLLPAVVSIPPEFVGPPIELGRLAAQLAAALRFVQAAGRGAERVADMGGASIDELVAEYRDTAEKYARQSDEANGQDVALPRLHAFWQGHAPAA